jgi:hypothetical protein
MPVCDTLLFQSNWVPAAHTNQKEEYVHKPRKQAKKNPYFLQSHTGCTADVPSSAEELNDHVIHLGLGRSWTN